MKNTLTPLVILSSLALLPGNGFSAEPGIYADIVAPLMEAKCVSCHGEEKQKGKLRLDTFDFIMQGAGGDQIVFGGDPKQGSFLERIHLPLDDDDHMPPEDEEQLTDGEVKLLDWWVEQGAKKDLTIKAAKKSKELEPIIAAFLKNTPTKKVAEGAKALTEAEKKALAEKAAALAKEMDKINASGASLMPISAEDETELRFTALNVAKEFGDKELAALKPVADSVKWLDLAGTKVTDKGLAQVAAMKGVTRLYLQNTAITDAGMNHLAGLSELEYLNLYGSKVSDAGLNKLGGLKKLKSVFLWQTKVTEKGAEALEKKIPGLEANIGWTEKDNAVVVASAEPPKPKEEPKKEAAAKPAAKPAEKAAAKPAAKPTPKPAPKPAAPTAEVAAAKAVADVKVAVAKAAKSADDLDKAAAEAKKTAEDARKAVEALEKQLKALEAAAKAKK